MGKILPQFKKSVIDDIVSSITSNTSQYYAFAANESVDSITFTGYIVNSVLIVTSIVSGTIIAGQSISGTNITPGTSIVSQLALSSGETLGGVGRYNITFPAVTFSGSITGSTLNVVGPVVGTITVGQVINGLGVIANTYITGYGTGSGGVGTYTVNIFQNPPNIVNFTVSPFQYAGNTTAQISISATTPVYNTDINAVYTSESQMLFGKKIANGDIVPMIKNIPWTNNTIYTRYDNTQDISLSNFYVVCNTSVGGSINIYKCIDNNSNGYSTIQPSLVQPTSFTTTDGYTWRYITTISNFAYQRWGLPLTSVTQYIPVYSNGTIVAGAYKQSGVEVVAITNAGSGYVYTNGVVNAIISSTLIKLQSTASSSSGTYNGSGIYLNYTNTTVTIPQVRTVNNYIVNSSGYWVILDSPLNSLSSLTASLTNYYISPKVVFQTDASVSGNSVSPVAYSVVNTVSNSVNNIVVVTSGYGISRATVSIQSNNLISNPGGAVAYAIVPPAGGHGASPVTELQVQGMGIAFNFANTENNTIPNNINYGRIGIVKNPYTIDQAVGNKTTTPYSSNTFISIIQANTNPSTTFTVGDTVTGNTSGSVGTIVFSNSSTLYLTGDKYFQNNEIIVSMTNNNKYANIVINTTGTRGNIYTKDLVPLYVQNINTVTRSNGVDTFKLLVQI
jgi:hypothetical protein